jgi:hypothetical protein
LELTGSLTFVEPWKQYRSIVEFNVIDSTVLINLGDPCKRALWPNFVGGVPTTAVQDRGQREQGSGRGRPLVWGSAQFANDFSGVLNK